MKSYYVNIVHLLALLIWQSSSFVASPAFAIARSSAHDLEQSQDLDFSLRLNLAAANKDSSTSKDSPTNLEFSFENTRLQEAVQVYRDAQTSASDGDHATACEDFAYSILLGRKIVLELQANQTKSSEANESMEPTAHAALKWLVSCYVSSGRSRMAREEWEMARKDFWAAGMYSQNQDVGALQAMYDLCLVTDDDFGQLTSLKALEGCLIDGDTGLLEVDEEATTTLEDVQQKLKELDIKLKTS